MLFWEPTQNYKKKKKKIISWRIFLFSFQSFAVLLNLSAKVFFGIPGVLSLCHSMDAFMQTNVSSELGDSIYPLSNYINRSWIVTNGSWRRRRRRGENAQRGAGEARDAWLHFSILFHSLAPPNAQIAPCAPFRNQPPLNNPKPPHTHSLTHWPTEPFSSLKDFYLAKKKSPRDFFSLFLFQL